MLTRTTETAIRLLTYMVLCETIKPLSPKKVAEVLNESPTYMSKISGVLVKNGILRAIKGTTGGIVLAQSPEQITLLSIVEACQGQIVGDYCQPYPIKEHVCGFHQAMLELHLAVTGILKQWTLADLASNPKPDSHLLGTVQCKLQINVPNRQINQKTAL